jgi:proteasome beta subunit
MNTEDLNKSMLKSSTSLVGIVCSDGVVLASDRRVTAGNLIVGKAFQKIFPVRDNLLVAFTGGVADAQFLLKLAAAELKLKELKSRRPSTVKESSNLVASITFRNIRQPSMIPSIVGTLIAGINPNGTAKLFSIEPAGAVSEIQDYDANFSSGMPYILGVLEKSWRKDITVKEGVQLAVDCLKASTQRDTGSGNGIDVYTLTNQGIKKELSQEIESILK